MRVRKNYALLFLLFIIIIVFSNLSLATSCTSDSQCRPGYCNTRDNVCINTCGSGGCQSDYGETSSTCCADCGCGSFGDNYECINNQCVPSFSSDGVCEYGSGEEIGDSFKNNVDDCDQDNDDNYDGFDSSTSKTEAINDQKPIDSCPNTDVAWASETNALRTSMTYAEQYDDTGCSCDQKTGSLACTSVDYDCTTVL